MKNPFKICDPIHGFIRFGPFEERVIDSIPFQRLRYIRQMGVAYLMYPGATHTRFEHSLGVMELAGRIFDAIIADWKLNAKEKDYWRLILRLAALSHDFGHLPFSHTAEQELLPDGGHEKMTLQIIQSNALSPVWKEIGPTAEEDVIKLAVHEAGFSLSPFEQVLAQVITEDNFGADRIDYLIRDAHYTGVGYGLFESHQLIDSLRILSRDGQLGLGINMGGIQSVEALWVARYMMHARVYQLSKSRIYTCHMRRFMCRHYKEGVSQTLPDYLKQTDAAILEALFSAAQKGDEDAEILLKQRPPYRELAVAKEQIPQLVERFGEQVIIDHLEIKRGSREFPVLQEDGEVISSFEASPFLRDIPPGGKESCLFICPDAYERVKQWLHESSE